MLQEGTSTLPFWGELGHRHPLDSALAAVAALLLGVAWLTVVGWARHSAARTIVAVIIGLQPLTLAVLVELELFRPGQFLALGTSGWLTWPAEILVLPMLLGAGWILDERPLPTIRLIVLGWGVTSFGSLHNFLDYALTTARAPWPVDTPFGLGYLTAATQVVVGVAVVVLSLVLRHRPEPEDGDERWGRDGFTLAA